ncbi:unnamed protein product [Gongylonema pulchrum]|uniref:SERPIN domain-containing protein n=1 Tax=Gongylonema pulchrum TaxID=637853 RepID=A0A183F0M2_9BILA|nr:unnamed protein product [Gongylonema pulchrum]
MSVRGSVLLFLPLIAAEPFLFPHGFFDMSKMKAKDAIYLNLLALSALEHGGITVDELNHLANQRSEEPRPPLIDPSDQSTNDATNLTSFDAPSFEFTNSEEPTASVFRIKQPNATATFISNDTSGHTLTTPMYPFQRLFDSRLFL